MANAWLAHVKSTMKSHKGMKFKDVLKLAKRPTKSLVLVLRKPLKRQEGKKGKKVRKVEAKSACAATTRRRRRTVAKVPSLKSN